MITQQQLSKFREKFQSDVRHQAVASALSAVGINDTVLDPKLKSRHPFTFSLEVKTGDITNQKRSGRCWMFASFNAARTEVIKKLNVKTFEFSEVYPLFWDKLEKSEYFLSNIIATLDEPVHSRLLDHLLANPLQDGGQWDMFAGILKKYGAVPKCVMPETYHSSNTSELVAFLTSKLREYACELRQMAKSEDQAALESRKQEMLSFIWQVLVQALGEPPEKFSFGYYDKDEKYHRLPEMTPQEFFSEYTNWRLEDKISVINAPTEDKPFNRFYTVKYLGSVIEEKPLNYLNVDIQELKKYTLAQLKDGKPVWFGCDVGKRLDRENALIDLNARLYEQVLGEGLTLNKAERLDYGDSLLTHAMVFLGVDLDDSGKPINWKVENSWGEHGPAKGIYSMSDEWFDEFVYEVMVDREFIDAKILKEAEEQAVIELAPWDPMGSLAR